MAEVVAYFPILLVFDTRFLNDYRQISLPLYRKIGANHRSCAVLNFLNKKRAIALNSELSVEILGNIFNCLTLSRFSW